MFMTVIPLSFYLSRLDNDLAALTLMGKLPLAGQFNNSITLDSLHIFLDLRICRDASKLIH